MSRAERRAGRRSRGPGGFRLSPRAISAGAGLALIVVGCTAIDGPVDSPSVSSAEMFSVPAPTSVGQPSASDTPTSAFGVTSSSIAPNQSANEFSVALNLLATLPVKGRAPGTGYSRELFGQAWSDDVTVDGGHNGCDTRNDILRRDLSGARIKDGTRGCVVLSGTLLDQYTGESNDFVRGSNSDDVQVDHLVSMSDAWATGAQQLTPEQRQNLANDPLNLQAVAGPVNQSKGSGDAATWLPPNKAYRCTFVSRQVEVKAKYQLWVKPAERDAIARVLGTCAPANSSSVAPSSTVTGSRQSSLESQEPNPSVPAFVPDIAAPYANCAAARAAVAAPLHTGDPGYSTEMDGDGDGDGIACE